MRALAFCGIVVACLATGLLLVPAEGREAFLAGAGCMAIAFVLGAVSYVTAGRGGPPGPRLVRPEGGYQPHPSSSPRTPPAGGSGVNPGQPRFQRSPGRMDGMRL